MIKFDVKVKSKFNQNALVKEGELFIYQNADGTGILILARGERNEKRFYLTAPEPSTEPQHWHLKR